METGDVERLTVLWTAAQPAVAAFVRTLVPDSHQMQDVLQQVALVVVRRFVEYDPARPFSAWAIGIAKQKVLAYRRQRRSDRLVFDDAVVEQIAAIYERSLSHTISDRRDALDYCVERLQGRARNSIQLFYGQGLKTSEIAQQLDLGHDAVRKLLSRTRSILRDCVQQRLLRSLQSP
jgi:RNA polymerase sigma-70 factor, ECF subfamily